MHGESRRVGNRSAAALTRDAEFSSSRACAALQCPFVYCTEARDLERNGEKGGEKREEGGRRLSTNSSMRRRRRGAGFDGGSGGVHSTAAQTTLPPASCGQSVDVTKVISQLRHRVAACIRGMYIFGVPLYPVMGITSSKVGRARMCNDHTGPAAAMIEGRLCQSLGEREWPGDEATKILAYSRVGRRYSVKELVSDLSRRKTQWLSPLSVRTAGRRVIRENFEA
ncbi:hypothetical protein C8R47DRAFT_1195113 [Mycena vitilis]|nr:hypothetical protein C8R47DRAFT_1195113 [Mycena vitilis]